MPRYPQPVTRSGRTGLLALFLLSALACAKTYSPQYLVYAAVDADNVDVVVQTVLDVLTEEGFVVRDAGADHPLTPESAALRRFFVGKHPSGVEVVLNNFYTPATLHIAFHLMDSSEPELLASTHTAVLERLRSGKIEFREVSEAERQGYGGY